LDRDLLEAAPLPQVSSSAAKSAACSWCGVCMYVCVTVLCGKVAMVLEYWCVCVCVCMYVCVYVCVCVSGCLFVSLLAR